MEYPSYRRGAGHSEYLLLFWVHKDHIALSEFQLTIPLLGEFDFDGL